MKVLAFSFLRVGDFFQHSLILDQVAKQHSAAEITVLGFTELKPAVNLFPNWNFRLLPRKELQSFFFEPTHSVYQGVYKFSQALSDLLRQDWDQILNLSHTQFASRMMDCFQSLDKRGVQFKDGQLELPNESAKYLNTQYLESVQPRSTLIELVAESVGIPLDRVQAVDSATRGSEIWLNPLTSDARKSWPLKNWVQLAQLLKASGQKFKVLCSPDERDQLSGYFDPQVLQALSFQEILVREANCGILVSGDTSLPHLLARSQTPTLMLFLGPANPFKTQAFNPKLQTLIGQSFCWPCSHKGNCSQARQLCADQISVRQVFELLQNHPHSEFEQTHRRVSGTPSERAKESSQKINREGFEL